MNDDEFELWADQLMKLDAEQLADLEMRLKQLKMQPFIKGYIHTLVDAYERGDIRSG